MALGRRRSAIIQTKIHGPSGDTRGVRIQVGSARPVILEQVESTDDQPGISVRWATSVAPKELLAACVDPVRATAVGDLVVVDASTGSRVEQLDLISENDVQVALDRAEIGTDIVRFNTPGWSLTIWPAPDGGDSLRSIEYCGGEYSSEVEGILRFSAEADVRNRVRKVLETLRKTNDSLRPTRGSSRSRAYGVKRVKRA